MSSGARSRVATALAVSAPPVLVGLLVAATTFPGTSAMPWKPLMVDLDVYRLAGEALLSGGDVYALPGSLPFLYPPFAALLAVPLAMLPLSLTQILWTVAGVLCVLAVLHRYGLRGWGLSLIATATMYFVEPVNQTLAFGQLGIVLMALVVLDLVPGPRLLPGRRLLPSGVLTALATAVKLTPGIFLLYLLAAGRRRAALIMIATGAAVTALAWVLAPEASAQFWGRLLHGDTGLGGSIIYYTNQSVMADIVRIFGLGATVSAAALVVAAAVAVLGIWAATLWHRLGAVPLAVSLAGIAGLLASPVSWSHHFVWIVPFALCLADRPAPQLRRPLPGWFLVVGWVFVGWVVASPFKRLPNGGDVELTWTWWQHLLASMTAVFGIVLLAGAVIAARRTAATLVDAAGRSHTPGPASSRLDRAGRPIT